MSATSTRPTATWSNTRGTSAYGNTILFTGRELDAETGLYNYPARWYHAGLGTFTTRDPLGFSAGDANLYRYVGGNPISRTDPSGMLVEEPTALLGGDVSECAYEAYDFSDPNGNWVTTPGGDVFVPQYGILIIHPDWCEYCGTYVGGYSVFNPQTQLWTTSIIVHTHMNPNYSPSPGYSDNYWDILFGRSQWDTDLGIGNSIAWGMIGIGGGGLIGIGAGTIIAGALAPTIGCNGAWFVGGLAGSKIGGEAGGFIGGIGGGELGATIGEIGASIFGGMIKQPCFVAGTPIMTPDGAKPIEQLKPGDMVLSSPEDDSAGPVQPRRVEEVFERSSVLLDVYIGGKLIRTTPEHPFYVQGKGWTAAKLLVVGDLMRSHDGRWVAVESACDSGEVAPVYNMRVVDDHTYFVGSADWGFSVWVHNSCDKIIEDITKSEKALENALREGDEAAINQAQKQLDGIRKAQEEFWRNQHNFKNNPDWEEPLIPGINC